MSEVIVSFNGRSYKLSCAADETDRLIELAGYVKGKFEALLAEHGAVGDDRLLVMTALMLADELWDSEVARAAALKRAELAEQVIASRPEPKPARAKPPIAAGSGGHSG